MNQRHRKGFTEVGFVLLLAFCVSTYSSDASKCETCKDLTKRFKEVSAFLYPSSALSYIY